MTITTEAAAALRKELKEAGFSSRKISVVAEHFSTDSAIKVTIKSEDIDIESVRTIAENYERLDFDEYGTPMLGGGRYVSVRYTVEITDKLWFARQAA